MTTNDYQWIPITTNDYQRLSERYQKDYLKRSIDIRWLFNPLLSLILRLSCLEKLTPLDPFSTPLILLLSFYGNISKKNSPCMSSFKGCSSVKQLFAKVWFMFMIVTWKKDSLTSSTWFIHVESMYFVAKSAHYETVSSQGKRLDLACRNGNVFDLHATTSSFEFSQFDQSNWWWCKIKNWFCLLSESLRIIFDREGETFKLTILQYAFFCDVTHCIETIGGQK